MADYYRDEHEGGGGFMMGLLTGTVLGAGLGMLLAPKSGSELRNQLTEGASSLGRRASGAVNEMTDRARDTAHRGAEQVRGRASDANVGPQRQQLRERRRASAPPIRCRRALAGR